MLMNLTCSEVQARTFALFGTGEEDEPGAWGYVDPQYLNELDEMIAKQKPKYDKPPKVIPLLTKAMIFLSNRYYSYMMHRLTMHETYLYWLKEREEYNEKLTERRASMAALRERNQRCRELVAMQNSGVFYQQ
jgi:hypothetical protein